MAKKHGKRRETAGKSPRLDPSARVTPLYDSTGIRTFPVADRKQMGMRVRDDFVEEHIQ